MRDGPEVKEPYSKPLVAVEIYGFNDLHVRFTMTLVLPEIIHDSMILSFEDDPVKIDRYIEYAETKRAYSLVI